MAAQVRDYYEILGIPRSSSQDEIKRAYRKQAQKWHPDKHKGSKEAEERFKEINRAHDVLSDPDKRRKYDKYGEHWEQADAYESAGIDPGAGFGWSHAPGGNYRTYRSAEDIFGDFDGFGDFFHQVFRERGRGPAAHTRGQDVTGVLYLTLAEALHGCSKTVRMQMPVVCDLCQGAGRAGAQICQGCAGSGTRQRTREIEVRVPAAVHDGATIRLAGQGMPGRNGRNPGDLLITLHLHPHPVFRLDGNDVELDLPVTPWELALGSEVEVPTLTGAAQLKIPPGTPNGRMMRLRGLGWPKKDGTKGNLMVRLVAAVPPPETPEQRKAYGKLDEVFGTDIRAEWRRRSKL